MTDSTEVNGRAKVCEQSEHRATPGQEANRPKNDKMLIWQIVIRQIVGDKLGVGKS